MLALITIPAQVQQMIELITFFYMFMFHYLTVIPMKSNVVRDDPNY